MTFVRRRVALAALAIAASFPLAASAQRNDSFTWKLGVNAGAMAFQTQYQDTKVIPSAGANVLIMAHRGGLLFGVDEGIGTDNRASSVVLFNDVRRYQAILMAFPISGAVEPYFGGGGGLTQVVGPRVDKIVTDPTDRQSLLDYATDHSTSGFVAFIAGVQGRTGRVTLFVQYEAGTSPGSDNLLKGSTQTILGGIRIGLGAARETIPGSD